MELVLTGFHFEFGSWRLDLFGEERLFLLLFGFEHFFVSKALSRLLFNLYKINSIIISPTLFPKQQETIHSPQLHLILTS